MENPAYWGPLENAIGKLWVEVHNKEPQSRAADLTFELKRLDLIFDCDSMTEAVIYDEIEKHLALPRELCGRSLMSKMAIALRENGMAPEKEDA